MYSVIVIDDSISFRKIVSGMIDALEEFEVVAEARDAYDAREKIKKYEPDLVTIDINMPKMDGKVFLRNLMRLHPMPAVVVSGEDEKENDIFDDGAVGFIPKVSAGESLDDFSKRVRESLEGLTFLLKRYQEKKPKPEVEVKSKKTNTILGGIERKVHPDEVLIKSPALLAGKKVIGIGSSTGGVDALVKVFEALPIGLAPIVISQHIPYGFSSSFANRLNAVSDIAVSEVSDGDELLKSHAYLAPGNRHFTIEKRGDRYFAKMLDVQKVSRHKPSVDIMFRSLNNVVGSSVVAIMLTGMGDDGMIASKELYDNGAYVIAQSEESCVVYGMPGKVVEIGAASDIVHLDNIPKEIARLGRA
jgi:two-component system chemotaxis response regulator CheB